MGGGLVADYAIKIFIFDQFSLIPIANWTIFVDYVTVIKQMFSAHSDQGSMKRREKLFLGNILKSWGGEGGSNLDLVGS